MQDRTNPEHYKAEAIFIDGKRFEPIDICECYDFCMGNALKYILRANRHQDGIKLNLQKARWYLKRCLATENFLKSYQSILCRLLICLLPDLAKRYVPAAPLAGKRRTVIEILGVYRSKFKLLDSLLESNGTYSMSSIELTICLIEEMIEDED